MKYERLEQLICDVTIPCADDGVRFTDTRRLDLIQNTLLTSEYSCFAEPPLARLYTHKRFRASCPFIAISCHIDSVYKKHYARRSEDELHGTFDNSACDAIALNAMMEERFGGQTVVCFTGNEENGLRGADHVIAALSQKGLLKYLEMVIAVDLTEEHFGKPCTAENLFVKPDGDAAVFGFPGKNSLGRYIEKIIPGTPVIKRGDGDEAWWYGANNLNCFSLCLPCRLLGGNMHDSRGVALTLDSIHEYATKIHALAAAIEDDLQTRITMLQYR